MPRLTLDEIKKAKTSADFRRLNPELFGPPGRMDAKEHGQSKGTLVKRSPKKRRGKAGIPKGAGCCITLIACLARRMDSDNLAHACKPLRDAISDYLGADDGDERLRWEYGQVETRGAEEVIVRMEYNNF
jgi:hypothetical protein